MDTLPHCRFRKMAPIPSYFSYSEPGWLCKHFLPTVCDRMIMWVSRLKKIKIKSQLVHWDNRGCRAGRSPLQAGSGSKQVQESAVPAVVLSYNCHQLWDLEVGMVLADSRVLQVQSPFWVLGLNDRWIGLCRAEPSHPHCVLPWVPEPKGRWVRWLVLIANPTGRQDVRERSEMPGCFWGALSERTDMPHSDRAEEPVMNVGGAFPPAAWMKMKPGRECLQVSSLCGCRCRGC